VVRPRPALVPLLLGDDEAGWTELAGVAADVVAQAGGAEFREKMLVTHRGLSGPAVLQASSYWRPGEALTLDFAPQFAAGTETPRGSPGAGGAPGLGRIEAGSAGGSAAEACQPLGRGWRPWLVECGAGGL